MRFFAPWHTVAVLAFCVFGTAGAQEGHDHQHGAPDSSFNAMQNRGRTVMGVDQYSSTHRFDDLPDGGRIELQRDPADTAGVAEIRHHLQAIARAFGAGDFSDPGLVHMQEVPGTGVMKARRTMISYAFHSLPGGGEVRIATQDTQAVTAVHAFLAFQRGEHRAKGSAATP